jgi:uncharacterized protein YodC (DUF2158 family)
MHVDMNQIRKTLTILALCAIMIGCEARVSYKTEGLEIGTKVQHKSGGPVMVVIEEAHSKIRCRWLDTSGVSYSEWFYAAEFETQR